jgi:hypothetical protein
VPAVTGLLSPSAHSYWAPFEFPLDWSLDESDHSDSLTMKRGQRLANANHDQQDGDRPRSLAETACAGIPISFYTP